MRRFHRITSSGRFIPEIDGLRFVAVASVVLYHLDGFLPDGGFPAPFGAAVAHGYRGVNLFYVVSGFVLGLPFASHYFKQEPRVSLKAYFLRRLTRLEPPYLLNLLLCFALLVFAQNADLSALLPHLGAGALYLHNIVYGEQSPVNPVAWTLEIEVQFYCLMPLFAVLFAIRSRTARRIVLVFCILGAGVTQFLFWEAPPRAKMSILFAVQFFLTGLLLADLYVTDWDERPASHWRWDLVSLAGWPVVFLMPDRAGWILFPYLVLLLYVAAFRGVIFRGLFRNSLVTAIGGMCYTIYLFHYQLIPLVLGSSFPAVYYFAVLSGVSLTYFLLIERPCMRKDWPQRLAARLGKSRSQ